MLLQHVGSVIWVHHEYCGFDWRLIDELRPDEVWWMPGERIFLCQHWPIGFPASDEGGRGEKKRQGVSVGRRMRWKIGRPFDNEIPAKTASCSTPKALNLATPLSQRNFVRKAREGDAVNEN